MFSLTHHNNTSRLIADTGVSDHYIYSKTPNYKKSDIRHPIRIALPNGSFLKSTQITHLPLPTLKKEAVKAHILPELKNTSLLSIGRLCNEGYIASFDKRKMRIFDSKEILRVMDRFPSVLEGERNDKNGLWEVKLYTTKEN